MATTEYYAGVGKSLIMNGSTFFTFYGKDFNPNIPSLPSGWDRNTSYASGETYYNLSGFSVGNEVCCCWFVISNDDLDNSVYISWDMDFQKSYNGSTYYSAGWSDSGGGDIPKDSSRGTYYYVGVDSDEIWIGETYYRFHIEWSSTDGSYGTINVPFVVGNLSFDDSLHPSGYLWVEGNYLCYTDATYGSLGYKHKINYDSYSGGTGDPGYVRIPSGTSGYIYYTDAYGRVRRTHFGDEWYGGNRYGSPGYVYVSDGDYRDGYGYLCFVDGNGMLRRMGNGLP